MVGPPVLQFTFRQPLVMALVIRVCFAVHAQAGDWPRFRGSNGSGISTDEKAPPTRWSETENLRWSLELPGPGLSSPIVVGHRVLLTCWSGYGTPESPDATVEKLKRHLVCVDRATGICLWSTTVDSVMPEDRFQGIFTENGYASHTPVSDGKYVYAFFGKSGVVAFDMEGNKIWHTLVGEDLELHGWGTASSPILFKNLVIITASVESRAIIALDRETGTEVWRQQADGLANTWGTPVLVENADGRTDLVLGVPHEIWAFNPESGAFRWFCNSFESNEIRASVIAHDGVIYLIDRTFGGSIAVHAGGDDDVTNSHVLWKNRHRGQVSTPLYHEGCLYWIFNRMANCIDAKTGDRIYQQPLIPMDLVENSNSAVGQPPPNAGLRNRRARAFGGGASDGKDYSSPVIAHGQMYFVARSGETYVIPLGRDFRVLAVNRVSPKSDDHPFNSTPAISDGEIFMRSTTTLYCISPDAKLQTH